MNKLLFDEEPLVVQRSLARLIGLDEAVMTQQLHYWLRKSGKLIEGRLWVYNSIPQWHSQFNWISETTVKRKIGKLVKQGLWLVGEYNKKSFDQTNWYTLDYERLALMCPIDEVKMTQWAGQPANQTINMTQPSGQHEPPHQVNLTRPIPENNQRVSQESNQQSKTPTPPTHAHVREGQNLDSGVKLWTDCLEALEKRLSKPSYETWLKNTWCIGFEDNRLIVAVPNDFAQDWLESRYAQVIKEELTNIAKVEIAVRVVVRTPEA